MPDCVSACVLGSFQEELRLELKHTVCAAVFNLTKISHYFLFMFLCFSHLMEAFQKISLDLYPQIFENSQDPDLPDDDIYREFSLKLGN